MPKSKKRLEDLYVLGRPVVVEATTKTPAGEDIVDQVEVWLQKMNPIEHEHAMRRASAEKARVLLVRNNPDSEQWLETYEIVSDMGGRETLVDYVVGGDLVDFEDSVEAELSMDPDEKWSKDNYYQGLKDLWEGSPGTPGLKERAGEEPPDPEYERVFAELQEFDAIVQRRVDEERTRRMKDYDGVSDEDLRRKVVDRYLEINAGLTWVREFHKQEILYATRDPEDHDSYYFAGTDGKPDRSRINALDVRVLGQLSSAYQEFTVPPNEGKDLPETPSSSQPSEVSGEAETAVPSGPVVATP